MILEGATLQRLVPGRLNETVQPARRRGGTKRRSSIRSHLVGPVRSNFELIAPEDFEATQHIADTLRAGVPVLIDFHACTPRSPDA